MAPVLSPSTAFRRASSSPYRSGVATLRRELALRRDVMESRVAALEVCGALGAAERRHLFDVRRKLDRPVTNVGEYERACEALAELTAIAQVQLEAMPPPGQDCPPGVGSSYVYSLKKGDRVTGIGSFGDFHIKPSQKEMVYIGGGAGMAPLRAHLSHLFETENTPRKVSFWYGARSRQEIFYESYFEDLAAKHENFDFQIALSEPLPEDDWKGKTGFIHEAVRENYLRTHSSPQSVDFYLCGPPMMIEACNTMLQGLGVTPQQIAYDAF